MLSLLSATANAITTHTHSLTLHQWPLSAPNPTVLGKVSYDPATGEGGFDVAEHKGAWAESGEEEEVRVGVWDGETWAFGCVVVGVSIALSVRGVIVVVVVVVDANVLGGVATVENVEASGECGDYG